MKLNFFRFAKTSIVLLALTSPELSHANIILAADGTTVYLRENVGVEYQLNDTTGTWTVISSFPVTLINIGGATSGIDINF